MDGFPGEIILVFSFLGLLMLGAALEDLKNYIIKKAHKGGKRKKEMEINFFKLLLRGADEVRDKAIELGCSTAAYIENLKEEIKELKNRIAYLNDDNIKVMHENRELKKKLEDLQGEYNLLEEENKHIHSALANALRTNGQLKRNCCSIGVCTEKSIFSKKPDKEAEVKAGEKNA